MRLLQFVAIGVKRYKMNSSFIEEQCIQIDNIIIQFFCKITYEKKE